VELGLLPRKLLSILTILMLLTSSIGGALIQYEDPDTWPGVVLHSPEVTAPISIVVTHDDGNRTRLCNHGCHVANDLLAHLNSFSALSAIVSFSIRISGFLVTPASSMLGETLFRPPR